MRFNLSIIIVNWNGINFLPDCLKSIVENPPSVPYEIIVVDNDSSDGSVAWMRSSDAIALLGETNFRLIESGGNLGFSKANNLAIDDSDSPVIFLLNPDTVVRKGAIDKLLATLESDENIGACAPKLLNADGSVQHSVWAFPPTPLTILFIELKLVKFLPKRPFRNVIYSSFWDYERRVDVPIISGAAIMAKRETVEQVGGLDPSFHMYGEDVEWCARIKKGGWRIFFEPDAEIFHFGGLSSSQRWSNSGTAVVKMYESGMELQLSNLPRYLVFLNSLTTCFTQGVFLLKNFLLRRDTRSLMEIIKIQLTGLKRVVLNQR